MKLKDLPIDVRKHWALHLEALRADNPQSLQEIRRYINSNVDLPNIKHPVYIHDWFEIPELREIIEKWGE